MKSSEPIQKHNTLFQISQCFCSKYIDEIRLPIFNFRSQTDELRLFANKKFLLQIPYFFIFVVESVKSVL